MRFAQLSADQGDPYGRLRSSRLDRRPSPAPTGHGAGAGRSLCAPGVQRRHVLAPAASERRHCALSRAVGRTPDGPDRARHHAGADAQLAPALLRRRSALRIRPESRHSAAPVGDRSRQSLPHRNARKMPDLVLRRALGPVTLLTLNRPHKLNALDYDLIDELMATLD